jgi:hypothetical protein
MVSSGAISGSSFILEEFGEELAGFVFASRNDWRPFAMAL